MQTLITFQRHFCGTIKYCILYQKDQKNLQDWCETWRNICRMSTLVSYARGGRSFIPTLLIPGGDKYLERRNDIFQGPSFFFPNIGKCSFWRSRAISYEFMQYANTETRMYIHMDSSPLLYYHISFNAWLPKLKCSTTAQIFLQSKKRDVFNHSKKKKICSTLFKKVDPGFLIP